jgi:hypothetical protein
VNAQWRFSVRDFCPEGRQGTFSRTVSLPQDLDANNVVAALDKGVLHDPAPFVAELALSYYSLAALVRSSQCSNAKPHDIWAQRPS